MITRISIVLALVLVLATGCMKKEGAAENGTGMSTADSMKAAWTGLQTAWDAGKVDDFDKYISPNFVERNPFPGQNPGLEGLKKMAVGMKAGFPDQKTIIDAMYVDSNMIIARSSMSGTNSGPMMGMPATNKKMMNVEGIDIARWENGKFVEHWGVFDAMTMMSQLGLMPPMHDSPMSMNGKMDDKKK